MRRGFFMKRIFARRAPIWTCLVLAALLFSAGCAGEDGQEGRTDKIAAADADFVLVFPPSSEGTDAVRCAGERQGNAVTLTVLDPERSAGIVVRCVTEDGTWADGRCEIEVPQFADAVEVGAEAGRALAGVFRAMYGGGEGLTLDAEGLPGAVERVDLGGNRHTVKVEEYVIKSTD